MRRLILVNVFQIVLYIFEETGGFVKGIDLCSKERFDAGHIILHIFQIVLALQDTTD